MIWYDPTTFQWRCTYLLLLLWQWLTVYHTQLLQRLHSLRHLTIYRVRSSKCCQRWIREFWVVSGCFQCEATATEHNGNYAIHIYFWCIDDMDIGILSSSMRWIIAAHGYLGSCHQEDSFSTRLKEIHPSTHALKKQHC